MKTTNEIADNVVDGWIESCIKVVDESWGGGYYREVIGRSNLPPLIGPSQLPQIREFRLRSRTSSTLPFIVNSSLTTPHSFALASHGFQILPCPAAGWPPIDSHCPPTPVQTLLRWSATVQRCPSCGTWRRIAMTSSLSLLLL